ncbi:flavoprotein-like protein [Leptodontidium sp. MPI-SDFR-AT-0119]|nr:flavoprotein-like protein [Leptodontidium sp. MPI-SDFR-AT-0119]
MKILGISAGSAKGNTELVMLSALQAAQAQLPDASIQFVRLEDIRIGRKLIAGQFEHPFAKEKSAAHNDHSPDDRPYILDLIMDADAILLGAPVLNRASAGLLKWFADNTLGPFQDISVATEMVKMGKGQMVDHRIFKPKVAALVSVGGALSADWTTFGLPTLNQLTFPMAMKVVDQIQVYGAGLPGCVVLNEAALTRAADLGRNLVTQALKPVEERAYVGALGYCPVCHLNTITLLGRNEIECSTCAAKGTLSMIDGEVSLNFEPEGLRDSIFKMEALVKHGLEIKEVAAKLMPQMPKVQEKAKELLDWGSKIMSTPPGLTSEPKVVLQMSG